MRLVYGFEAPVIPQALPYVVLLVDIISTWSRQSTGLRNLLDRYGGVALFKQRVCYKTRLCDLCSYWKYDDRENLHKFLDTVYQHCGKAQFRIVCQLAKFVDWHRSELFKKRCEEPGVLPHLRLKYK